MPLGCSWQPRPASILEQLPLSFRSWVRQSSSKGYRYPRCCAPIPCPRYTLLMLLMSSYATAHKAGRGNSAEVCIGATQV